MVKKDMEYSGTPMRFARQYTVDTLIVSLQERYGISHFTRHALFMRV